MKAHNDVQLDIDITLDPDSKFHDPPTIKKGDLLRPPKLDRRQSGPLSWNERPTVPPLQRSRAHAPWSQYLPSPNLHRPSFDKLFPHFEGKKIKENEKNYLPEHHSRR